MYGKDAISYVRLLIKEPDQDHYTDDNVLLLVNEGRREVARETEILEGVVALAVVAGTAIPALPSRVLKIVRVWSGPTELTRTAADSLAVGWLDETGAPTAVVPRGIGFQLYPAPSAGLNLKLEAVLAPADLANDDTTVSEAPDIDRTACEWAAHQLLDMDESPRADRMLAKYQDGLARLKLAVRRARIKEDLTVSASR